MTLRSRLTIWYGLTFMLLIALIGIVVWSQAETRLRSATEEALRIHAADVAADLNRSGLNTPASEPSLPGTFTAVIDPAGALLDAGPGTPSYLPSLPLGGSSRQLVADGPTYAFFMLTLPDARTVVTGRSLAEAERSASQLAELLIMVGAFGAIGALAGGWWLAGRAMAPIDRLTREAAAIGPDELSRRLAVGRSDDEIGRLATTLNGLFDRIEASVEHERSFVSGAAHDLRTPIAAVRMLLDLSLRDGSLAGKARASVEDASQAATDLGELADGLLGLAEAQTRGPGDSVATHVLPELVSRAEQEVEWLARGRGVRITTDVQEAAVRTSAVRFHQALVNILSNAVRHGPAGETVELSVRVTATPTHPGDVVLAEVADRGPGVDASVVDSLFTPFAVRRSGMTTHGLGLATAAAAVASQGGRIGFRERPGGGSVFWFWLPNEPREGTAHRS